MTWVNKSLFLIQADPMLVENMIEIEKIVSEDIRNNSPI